MPQSSGDGIVERDGALAHQPERARCGERLRHRRDLECRAAPEFPSGPVPTIRGVNHNSALALDPDSASKAARGGESPQLSIEIRSDAHRWAD